jgi:hypothetical protein
VFALLTDAIESGDTFVGDHGEDFEDGGLRSSICAALGCLDRVHVALSFVTGREQLHAAYGGRVWHLWMESGGSWQRSGSLTTALRAQTRPLAPDLMLILPGEAAFVIDCKCSANTDDVGRIGLAQTLPVHDGRRGVDGRESRGCGSRGKRYRR